MQRIDTASLKRDHPIEAVVQDYGIELRSSGRSLVGRCPFHDDGGKPNLYVYRDTESWYCYRCGVGGDVIDFVGRMNGLEFHEAVTRLSGRHRTIPSRTRGSAAARRTFPARQRGRDPVERACLAAAVDVYHNRLLTDPTALAYIKGRGLDRSIIECCRLGYAAGDELVSYLRWRHLPIGAAMRVGLLARDGREFLAGRVVVPEIRGGQPIWLIGRTIDPADDRPKYLGLPGRKPLLGWEGAKDASEVFLVEGVFDWLTLAMWGCSALALVGTHARPEVLTALARFARVFLLLDNDQAGRDAVEHVANALGDRAVVVPLSGVKDVADMAMDPKGRRTFVRAIGQSILAPAA